MKTVCSIGAFVQTLGTSAGRMPESELIRISTKIDPQGELSEIVHQIDRRTEFPPVILFDDVRGSQFPVVVNLMATEQRCAQMLGVPTWEEIRTLFPSGQSPVSEGKSFLWSSGKEAISRQRTVASQQVVRLGSEVDLFALPGVMTNHNDSYGCIFRVQSITKGSVGDRWAELCQLHILDEKTLICDWPADSASRRHLDEARQAGRPLPVVFTIGADTACYAMDGRWLDIHGTCWGSDLWEFLGRHRDAGYAVSRARTVDVDIAGEAEIILEGMIDTSQVFEPENIPTLNSDRPSRAGEFPLVKISAVTHKALPVVPMVLPETRESHLADRLLEQVAWNRLGSMIPELKQLCFPAWHEGHQVIIVSLDSARIERPRQLIHAIWSLPVLCDAKLVIVVNDDVDVRNQFAVWRAIARESRFPEDLEFSKGPVVPEWVEQGHGSGCRPTRQRIGIDATRKLLIPESARQFRMENTHKVMARWDDYGLSKYF